MEFRSFLLLVLVSASTVYGQSSPSDAGVDKARLEPARSELTRSLPPRKLAEGVMTVVAPARDAEDTALGPYDLDLVNQHPELAWTAPDFPENKPFFASPTETLLAMSRGVTFRHEVWSLEFAFKPMRVIEADIPQPSGKMKRQVVWYMVYSVRYPGQDLAPNLDATSGIPDTPSDVQFDAVRFVPRFSIVSKERNLSMDSQVLPTVKNLIAGRERVGEPLLDPIEMSKIDIPLWSKTNKTFWGVAMWTDVDPKLDFFAVDVRGLTNAYRIRLDSSGEQFFERKTLRIFHWRAGDEIDEGRDRIRLGLPAIEGPSSEEAESLAEVRSELRKQVVELETQFAQYLSQGRSQEAEQVALQIPEIQREISSLNVQLRMKDAMDKFNLKERLDYQWIYR